MFSIIYTNNVLPTINGNGEHGMPFCIYIKYLRLYNGIIVHYIIS